MINPRFAIAFLTVAEERSFTRAAERLNTSQSWVWEQVRKLEEILAFRLLIYDRSRGIELTQDGEDLLAHIRQFADAATNLEKAIEEAKLTKGLRLRIGDALFESRQRDNLFDDFIRRNASIRLEIHKGAATSLCEELQRSNLDIILAWDHGGKYQRFERVVIKELEAYALVPADSGASDVAVCNRSFLASRTIALSPIYTDKQILIDLMTTLGEYGPRFIEAPEANRERVERFARLRGALALRWRRPGQPKRVRDGIAEIPFERPVKISAMALRMPGPIEGGARRFWALLEQSSTRQPGS